MVSFKKKRKKIEETAPWKLLIESYRYMIKNMKTNVKKI